MKQSLLFIITCYLFILPYARATSFGCVFNTQHSKGDKASKDHILSFDFDTSKDTSKSLQLQDYRFLIWGSGDYLMIKIKGGEFSKALSSQFSLSQDQARFHYGEDLDFSCKKKMNSSKGSISDYASAQDKIKIKVVQDILFPYQQLEEVELMRTLFFQDKKIYSESSKLIPKLPWCSLRIQLSRNEDTTVNKGEAFTPVSFETHNNNSYFTTYSYSFVDFASGKKRGMTRLYSPFIFNCNVLRGMTFNHDTLESIVGKYLDIEAK